MHTTADVITSDLVDQAYGAPFIEIQNLPAAVLGYLIPSRYCESDRFHQMATEITAGQAPGYDQVAAIISWMRSNISFCPESSDTLVSAAEVNVRNACVCRDFAHLDIA